MTNSPLRKKNRCASTCAYIFPLVTPQSMDPAHPFPFISNLSLNLLVTFATEKNQPPVLGTGQGAGGLGSSAFHPGRGGTASFRWKRSCVHNLDLLFPGMDIAELRSVPGHPQCQHRAAQEKANDLLE